MNIYNELILSHDALFEQVCNRFASGVVIYGRERNGEAGEFRILGINPTAVALSRLQSADDVLGRNAVEVFDGMAQTGLPIVMHRVLDTGQAETLPPVHYVDATRDGWYRNAVYRVADEIALVVFTDVTEQISELERFKATERRFELLTSALEDGIFDWDPATGETYFSPAYKAQLGYRDDEFPNLFQSWLDHLHPDDRERCVRELETFRAGRDKVWEVEFRYRHKQGHYKWIRARASGVRDPESGELTRLLGVHVDIDQYKRDQAEIERRRDIDRTLLKAMPDLLLFLDSDGTIIEYHAAEGSALERPDQEVLGAAIESVMPPEIAELHRQQAAHAVATGSLVTFEYEMRLPGGEHRFEARVSASGDTARVAVIVRDITFEHLADLELDARVRELSALYHIFRLSRSESDLGTFARHLARRTLDAMFDPAGGHCSVTIDGTSYSAGKLQADSHAPPHIGAPVFDGGQLRGRIQVSLRPGAGMEVNDKQIVNSAAQALGVRLRADRALHQIEKYRHIVANTSDRVALISEDRRIELVNSAFAKCIGLPESQLIGRYADALLTHRYGEAFTERLNACLQGTEHRFQHEEHTESGSRFLSVVLAPYIDQGRVIGAVITEHDLTSLHRAQAGLRKAAKVFESAAEAIIMCELDATITDVNPALEAVTGFSRDDLIGRGAWLLSATRNEQDLFEGIEAELKHRGIWRGEVLCRRVNDEHFPARMTVSVVYEDERPCGYVGMFADITLEKAYQSRLEQLAHHDPLTGLPNRIFLSRVLERTLEMAERNGDRFTLMYIDLDRFKEVNDSLGHKTGDELLRIAVQRMIAVLRANDTLARVGGDEFVGVLPGADADTDAATIADKLLDTLCAPFTIGGQEISISASIGIAGFPEDGRKPGLLLHCADTAMYGVKRAGRAGWERYKRRSSDV